MTDLRSQVGLVAAARWRSLLRVLFGAIACPVLLSGCVGQVRGEPLFGTENGLPPPQDQVAQLFGLIESVDGRDVPTGHRFELLPGCHLVINSERWSQSDSQGTIAATLRPRTFAIFMRAGNSYVIRVRAGILSSSTGTAELIAEEMDPGGRVTRQFHPGQPCAGG